MSALLKLFAVAVVLFVSSPFARAQIEDNIPCTLVVNSTFYNFSVLAGTQITGHDSGGGWTYYLNMCRVAPACRRDGAMICQSPTNDPTTIYDVAFPNDDVAIHYWSIIPGGVSLTSFGSGIYCQAEGNERKGIVDVLCDPNYTGPLTAFSGPVVEGPPCTYTMTINHTSGCGQPYIPTTTLAPTVATIPSSSTDQSTVTGAGVGVGIAIGVVVTAAAVLVYVYVARRGGARPGSKWNKMDEDKNMSMGTMGGTTSEATNM